MRYYIWPTEGAQHMFAFLLIQDIDCQLLCAQHLDRNNTSRRDLKTWVLVKRWEHLYSGTLTKWSILTRVIKGQSDIMCHLLCGTGDRPLRLWYSFQKTQDLNLVTKKHQRNSNQETFWKTTGLEFRNVSVMKYTHTHTHTCTCTCAHKGGGTNLSQRRWRSIRNEWKYLIKYSSKETCKG